MAKGQQDKEKDVGADVSVAESSQPEGTPEGVSAGQKPFDGEPAIHDPLGLAAMTDEEAVKHLVAMDRTRVNGLLIDAKQEQLQGSMISGVKGVFEPYPFRPEQTVILTVQPENGSLTVHLSKGTVKKKGGNRKGKVEVTNPEGETEMADSAAAYCRDHSLDPKGGSAVAFLTGKGYTVEEVEG